MCGITGIFNYKTKKEVHLSVLKRMTNKITHRGPDDTRFHLDNFIGFGFTRLSIIDVSLGSQPMTSKCERYIIIFNGEIYNFEKLKKKYLYNFHFETNSDTEVLLAMYIKFNTKCFKYLDGMFAIAIYDKYLNELVLIRDRLGKKPLFWTETKNGIIFASEIKSILENKDIKFFPNLTSISDFFTLGYCPGNDSSVNKIKQVEPGSFIKISKSKKFDIWWKLSSSREVEKQKNCNWENKVKNSIKSAIIKRLRSDVPLGLFLSGGLDSSLILAIIKETGIPKDFVTYTAAFDSVTYNESNDARYIADLFKVKNKSVKITPKDFVNIFDDVVYKSDNLIANPAIFANYILSLEASKKIKVALNGGGADELFFGYETYKADILSNLFHFIPTRLNNHLISFLKKLPTSHNQLNFKYKAIKFLSGLNFDKDKRHYYWRTIITDIEKQKILKNISLNDTYSNYKNAYDKFDGDNLYEKFSYADLDIWWKKMGLYQGDSMSMANSLELRMPFMDHKLIELIFKIPTKVKFKNGKLKYFFKCICKSYLPNEILNKPKSGFHLPLAEWFHDELRDFTLTKLSYDRVKKIDFIDYDKVHQILNDHHKLVEDNSFKISNLLVFVEWYSKFFNDINKS